MNREEFFAKLSRFDEDGLRKVLWNLYWRGSAPLRERIEGELDPAEHDRRRRAAAQPADPDWVLDEVREFAELARAGAHIAGDRRVSPKERTRWRVTFRRLAADAQSALRAEDPGPAEEALALIIDLACEMRDGAYFRSEDPVEALDRLASHPALAGPELTFLQARLARGRGDLGSARKLVQDGLQELPGHQGFASFAAEIGANLPPRARQLAGQRPQWQAVSDVPG